MNLAQPHALWCLLLAIPVVLLYRRRQAVSRVEVSTAFLWPEVWTAFARQMAAQRWRTIAGLALNLTILLLLTLALADPRSRRPLREALVFGDPQPAAVQQNVHLLIEQLGPRDRLAVISASDHVRIHCPLTSDRERIAKAVNEAAQTKSAKGDVLLQGEAAAVTMMPERVISSARADAWNWNDLPADRPWWIYPALAALLLMAIEWPLYQRKLLL